MLVDRDEVEGALPFRSRGQGADRVGREGRGEGLTEVSVGKSRPWGVAAPASGASMSDRGRVQVRRTAAQAQTLEAIMVAAGEGFALWKLCEVEFMRTRNLGSRLARFRNRTPQ